MDGQRAVFERGILAQRPLLIRTPTRSKGHMNIPPRLGYTAPCGSGLARESGVSVDKYVECEPAFASKPAPTF
ncbi:hypothetical protein EAH78_06400 [Pseudomonas arsenicoxydans]|uniref:Uncharacterized protein n=1 Tax=Pseudomonas arsenicoxydans TaxID=702115 RepID=A0A502I599_9PSED|nr:hypothetical protein EAH78_06400 [Pseudomonas arsenicoxydans]